MGYPIKKMFGSNKYNNLLNVDAHQNIVKGVTFSVDG